MDLTAWLLRHTPPRPLVVAVPGGTEARLAVEQVVRERGWQFATSPAEANILVVAGPMVRGAEPYVARVWEQVPAPRARVDVRHAGDAADELEAAVAHLRDVDHQRQQATRPGPEPVPTHPNAEEHGHETHSDSEHDNHHHAADHNAHDTHDSPSRHEHHDTRGQHGHEPHPDSGHEHHAADHGSHGHDMHSQHGHDMGGMAMPGNVPMADRAEDRDGLMLDQLHVPLGPVLPDWPAGLIVRTSLQGDVIQEATVEVLDGAGSFWSSRPGSAARGLDSCARLLSVAGWHDAALVARRLRDAVLDGEQGTTASPLARWVKRVRRSRTLRWLLAGVGTTPDDPTTPAELRGDALTRLHRWLESALGQQDKADDELAAPQWTVDNLPALVEGSELATARLIVASLDPDLEVLARREVHHHG